MTRTIRIPMPVALGVAVLLAALALYVTWNSSAPGGTKDTVGIKGVISYEIRDASGNLKASKVIPNTVLTALKNDARARLGVTGVADLTDSDLYDNIQACSADASGGTCTLVTHTSLQVSSANANPADGTNSAGGTGIYTTTVTWTAAGSVTIEELQLTKGAATSGTAESAGAYQNVSVSLVSGDTLQVTWTITISS